MSNNISKARLEAFMMGGDYRKVRRKRSRRNQGPHFVIKTEPDLREEIIEFTKKENFPSYSEALRTLLTWGLESYYDADAE